VSYRNPVEKEQERVAHTLAEACRRVGMPFGSPIGQDPADGLTAALESALLNAYEVGARDMRERAAVLAHAAPGWARMAACDGCAANIRALPLRVASQEGK